eukprot:1148097-Pelagomonas_calceolata.AAC.3
MRGKVVTWCWNSLGETPGHLLAAGDYVVYLSEFNDAKACRMSMKLKASHACLSPSSTDFGKPGISEYAGPSTGPI